MKLTQGMFDIESGPKPKTPFNLKCGQVRSRGLIHNSGWYNIDGEKIGWGDLSTDDVKSIMDGLEPHQVFMVLGEQESFWDFTRRVGMIGSASNPGRKYVEEHMKYLIIKEDYYRINNDAFVAGGITREAAKLAIQILTQEHTKEA